MKILNIFGTPSIRRRITSSFVLMTLFVIISVVVSYFQLRQIRPFSDLIIQDSEELVKITEFSNYISALDADVERYLTLRAVENRESVIADLKEMEILINDLKADPDSTEITRATVTEMGDTLATLQTQVDTILNTLDSASAAEINRSIVAVYGNIDQMKQLQEKLSAETLALLKSTAEAQGRIASTVLTQSVFLGVMIIVISVITSFTTDRRLRTISILTNTASEIAKGDLTKVAPVESNDEIGTLAESFNSMTGQLRDQINLLEQRVAERTRALAATAEVSRRLSTILDEIQLVKEVVDQVQDAFDYYHVHIYSRDAISGDLIMAGGTGEAGVSMLARGHKVTKGRGLVGRAAETNSTVLVADTSEDAKWLPNPLLPDTKSEVAVPISMGDQVLGVLDVQQNIVNGLSQDDATLLQSIANQVAIAMRNARSYEESRSKAELESTINAIGQKIQRAGTVEDVLQTAIREVGMALGAIRVSASLQPDRTAAESYTVGGGNGAAPKR